MDAAVRAENIKELAKQLDVLETYIRGPYVVGEQLTSADMSILPTLVMPCTLHLHP